MDPTIAESDDIYVKVHLEALMGMGLEYMGMDRIWCPSCTSVSLYKYDPRPGYHTYHMTCPLCKNEIVFTMKTERTEL